MAPTKNQPMAINPDVFADDSELPATATSGTYVIDFAKVSDPNELIDAGRYNCTIVHAEPKMSKNNNPMIAIRWRIDDDGKWYHRTIFDNLVFTENALWKVRQVLSALGFDKTFSGEITPESLLGESATLVVTVKAGEGIDQETGEPYPAKNNISKVLPIGNRRVVEDLL